MANVQSKSCYNSVNKELFTELGHLGERGREGLSEEYRMWNKDIAELLNILP